MIQIENAFFCRVSFQSIPSELTFQRFRTLSQTGDLSGNLYLRIYFSKGR